MQNKPRHGMCHSELKAEPSHLQHFASHCPDHVLETLQNSYSTSIVQQMGGYRDDLKKGSGSHANRGKFQVFSQICLTSPKSLQPWGSTIQIPNKEG